MVINEKINSPCFTEVNCKKDVLIIQTQYQLLVDFVVH